MSHWEEITIGCGKRGYGVSNNKTKHDLFCSRCEQKIDWLEANEENENKELRRWFQ